jgi:hypothetical protein
MPELEINYLLFTVYCLLFYTHNHIMIFWGLSVTGSIRPSIATVKSMEKMIILLNDK